MQFHDGSELTRRTHKKKIAAIKEQLEKAQSDADVPSEEIMNLKWKLCTAFREEELYWRQKSRALWLKNGDKKIPSFSMP